MVTVVEVFVMVKEVVMIVKVLVVSVPSGLYAYANAYANICICIRSTSHGVVDVCLQCMESVTFISSIWISLTFACAQEWSRGVERRDEER